MQLAWQLWGLEMGAMSDWMSAPPPQQATCECTDRTVLTLSTGARLDMQCRLWQRRGSAGGTPKCMAVQVRRLLWRQAARQGPQDWLWEGLPCWARGDRPMPAQELSSFSKGQDSSCRLGSLCQCPVLHFKGK